MRLNLACGSPRAASAFSKADPSALRPLQLGHGFGRRHGCRIPKQRVTRNRCPGVTTPQPQLPKADTIEPFQIELGVAARDTRKKPLN